MKCTFCGKEILQGTGKIYVKTDGKIFYFCSGKCEKNMIARKRNLRTIKWTETAHQIKAQVKDAAAKNKAQNKE